MDRHLTRAIITIDVVELISKELKIPLDKARDLFYESDACKLLEDDSTGLYDESPWRTFELFLRDYKKNK